MKNKKWKRLAKRIRPECKSYKSCSDRCKYQDLCFSIGLCNPGMNYIRDLVINK